MFLGEKRIQSAFFFLVFRGFRRIPSCRGGGLGWPTGRLGACPPIFHHQEAATRRQHLPARTTAASARQSAASVPVGTRRTRPVSRPATSRVARPNPPDTDAGRRAAVKKSCEFAKTFGFHNWVPAVSGRRTCEHCGGEFVDGDVEGDPPQPLRPTRLTLDGSVLKGRGRLVAGDMSADDLRVLFVRGAAREWKEIWVDLSQACSASDAVRQFDQWSKQYRIEIAGSRGNWFRELGSRRVLPIAWSPTYSCEACELGKHRVGTHWHEAALRHGKDNLQRRHGTDNLQRERRLDAVHVQTAGLRIPYRRPREAEIAIDVLIRHRLRGQSVVSIVNLLGGRGDQKSEGAIRELMLRASRASASKSLGKAVRRRQAPW